MLLQVIPYYPPMKCRFHSKVTKDYYIISMHRKQNMKKKMKKHKQKTKRKWKIQRPMQQFRKVNSYPLKEHISRGISKAQLSTKDLENSEKQENKATTVRLKVVKTGNSKMTLTEN